MCLAGSIRLEGDMPHWRYQKVGRKLVPLGYWVRKCALLEVSDGKTVLLVRKYSALIVRASFMRVPLQSLQNVTVSLSSHCRMLQYPSAVTAECYRIPHDRPLAVTAECYIKSR
jgi:hypothetical protein